MNRAKHCVQFPKNSAILKLLTVREKEQIITIMEYKIDGVLREIVSI